MTILSLTESCQHLTKGHVIAYPTEAVFGLGCDPDNEQAVFRILQLKHRSIEKGLILIGSDLQQFSPYINFNQLSDSQKNIIQTKISSPITWVVPKNNSTPYFLTGKFDSIAIRLIQHPLIKQLCYDFGKPIVSTSANLSGKMPCRSYIDIEQQFGKEFPVLSGSIGNNQNPSQIRDIKTGKILRQG